MVRCQLLGHLQAGSLEAAGAGWERMTVTSSSSGAPFVCPAVLRPNSARTSCRPRLTHISAHSWLLIFSLLVRLRAEGAPHRGSVEQVRSHRRLYALWQASEIPTKANPAVSGAPTCPCHTGVLVCPLLRRTADPRELG